MSAVHREWQLDLAQSDLRDDSVEAICEKRIVEHRERRKIAPSGKLGYQEIDVSQNSITHCGFTTILDVCLQCTDLRVVKLFKNELSDLAAPSLCRLIEECRGLEQLHLSYNLLTASGAKDIVTAAHRGRSTRLQANEKDKSKPGYTLWLRLEHNKINNSAGLLEELTASGCEFCEAKDALKCGPRHCKHGAPLHLPYFSKQNVDFSDVSTMTQAPPKKSQIVENMSSQASEIIEEDGKSEESSSSDSLEVIDLPSSGKVSPTKGALVVAGTKEVSGGTRSVPDPSTEHTKVLEKSEGRGSAVAGAPEGAKGEAAEPVELLATSDPYALDIELDAEEFEAPDIIAALKTPASIDPEVPEPVKETHADSDVEADLEGDFNIVSPADDAPVETSPEAKAKAELAKNFQSELRERLSKSLAEAEEKSKSRDSGMKRTADAQTDEAKIGMENRSPKDDSHQKQNENQTKKQKQDTSEKKRKHNSDGSVGSESGTSKKHQKQNHEALVNKDGKSKDEKESVRPSGSPPQAHAKGHAAEIQATRPKQHSKKIEKTKEQKQAEVKEAFGLNDDEDVPCEKEHKEKKASKDPKESKESSTADKERTSKRAVQEKPKVVAEEKTKASAEEKPKAAANPKDSKDIKTPKDSKDAKHVKHKKEPKEHKEKKATKDPKESKESSAPADKDRSSKRGIEEKPKALGEEKPTASIEEKPKAVAKALAGLGNIAELQKQIADERAKLRLFVIKAKQEWEERRERGKARGETNEQEYYMASEGEVLGPNREFSVVGGIGRGVFSSVFEVKNTKEGTGDKSYAVKFVRSNHMMRKAAEKEVELYRRLAKQSPKEDAEASQFLMILSGPETFVHHGHLAMVFELQKCDLRTAMHKYGQGKGLPLQTVAQYLKQIFLGLRVLRKLKIIHGDLKPDNILMSLSKTDVKVCDFGSAMDVSTAEEVKTAYLQPRYYRAPEIIIGIAYDTQIDLWSAGVTAFELGTGKMMFKGRTNNGMLRAMLDTCGEFPKRMITEGSYASKHFNANGDLVYKDTDSLTGLPEVLKMKNFQRPPKPVTSLVDKVLKEPPPNADSKTQERLLPRLTDLVTKCIRINQEERITPDLALQHNFFKKGG